MSQIMGTFAFSSPERDPRAVQGMRNLHGLRRRQLWQLADRLNVPYPVGATKDTMLTILSAVPHMHESMDAAVQAAAKQNPDSASPLPEAVADALSAAEQPKLDTDDPVLMQSLREGTMHYVRTKAKEMGIKVGGSETKRMLLEKMGMPESEMPEPKVTPKED